MGKAAAVAVASRGGSVLLASRSQDKLDSAAEEIRSAVPDVQLTTRVLDASDEMAVQAFGEELDTHDHRWDALICTAAGKAPHGPIGELSTSDTAALFASKFWTAHNSCKHIAPRLVDGGVLVEICSPAATQCPARPAGPGLFPDGTGHRGSLEVRCGRRELSDTLGASVCGDPALPTSS